MKTIKEWFLSYDKDINIKNKLLAYLLEAKAGLQSNTFENALQIGFVWKNRIEGENYWHCVYSNRLNEIKNINPKFDINGIKLHIEGKAYILCHHDPYNCKLSNIDFIGAVGTVENLKQFLPKLRLAVSLNTKNHVLAQQIKDNFELYAYQEVPIGYGVEGTPGGNQYHMIIKNDYTITSNKSYLRKPIYKNEK